MTVQLPGGYTKSLHCNKELIGKVRVHLSVADITEGNDVVFVVRAALSAFNHVVAMEVVFATAGLAEVKKVASEIRTLDCWYPVSFNSLIYFENDVVGILQANWRN